ncbi:hypothetical protein Pmani_036251 [Petrolisthes manimaculis]|uniref:Angiotensin-converting enzyme n=1 Tax=Petrolisthes manimaculis TaxID=1843537 RepID=A0AAE1TPK7_9EUCA|nr:hypothetical protein Pmani_036251 [Petrolisthes manimaculis]
MSVVVWSFCFLLALLFPGASQSAGGGGGDGGIPMKNINLERVVDSFLEQISSQAQDECNKLVNALWTYYTNITDHNKQAMVTSRLEFGKWDKEATSWVRKLDPIHHHLSPDMKRQLYFLRMSGTSALPTHQLEELTNLTSQMTGIHSTATTCHFNNRTKCDLNLQPDLVEVMESSRDHEELSHTWLSWRDSSGKKMRQLYGRYVELSNIAAKLNGYSSKGDMWLSNYGEDTKAFVNDLSRVYQQIEPLYLQLHAYVRRKLRETYGQELVSRKGPIPAHLLGSMYPSSWRVYPLVTPFPNKTSIDVTDQMREQGYTPRRMFELADDFFSSLGLPRLPASFWRNTMMEKPKDRQVVCHPSAWDFCDGKDFRIKMCTKVSMKHLMTIYHELGHIHYFMQYAHLPYIFREGANRGFHEALGDVVGMNVVTPTYLHKVGLLSDPNTDHETEINLLLESALSRVAMLPFSYLLDLWRLDVFSGKVPEAEWNCAWWKRRVELQGVKPPVTRTEEDFDPGTIYHVVADVSYLRYLVAVVLQYQFHEALCRKVGQYPLLPLHKCTIYGSDKSTEAGNLLKSMMKLGRSVEWKEALREMTGGSGELDATALREYFRPLEDWLIADNARHGEYVGWQAEGNYCGSEGPHSITPPEMSPGTPQ